MIFPLLVIDHLDLLAVQGELVEGGDLQAQQHPPWAAEDHFPGQIVRHCHHLRLLYRPQHCDHQEAVLYEDDVKMSEVMISKWSRSQ